MTELEQIESKVDGLGFKSATDFRRIYTSVVRNGVMLERILTILQSHQKQIVLKRKRTKAKKKTKKKSKKAKKK